MTIKTIPKFPCLKKNTEQVDCFYARLYGISNENKDLVTFRVLGNPFAEKDCGCIFGDGKCQKYLEITALNDECNRRKEDGENVRLDSDEQGNFSIVTFEPSWFQKILQRLKRA
jgi:hypothetical protein